MGQSLLFVIVALSLGLVTGSHGASAVGYPCVSMRVEPVAPGLAVGTVTRVNHTACGSSASSDVAVAVNDTCALDSAVNRVLAFSKASLSTGNVFCRASLGSGTAVGDSLDPWSEECRTPGRCSQCNVSLQLPYNAATRSMWAALLDGGSHNSSSVDDREVVSWFATIRFSAWNRSSSWMCIDTIFVARRESAGDPAPYSLEVVRSLNFSSLAKGDCNTSCVVHSILTPCVFGLGINRLGGGAGPKFSDFVVFTNGTLLQYRCNNSSRGAALPPTWSKVWNQSNYDAMEEAFLINRTRAGLGLLGFEHRLAAVDTTDTNGDRSTALLPAVFSQLSGTLMFLWPATVTFCQRRLSSVRKIAGGNLISVDVLVAVDFSLQDTFMILPLAIAKAIAVRSTVVDASKCTLDCSEGAAMSTPSTCRYQCLLVAPMTSSNQTSLVPPPSSSSPPSYAANATVSTTSAVWTGSLPSVRIQPFDSVAQGTAVAGFDLNISSLVRVESGVAALTMQTWSPVLSSLDAGESSAPLLLLGARAFAPVGVNTSTTRRTASSSPQPIFEPSSNFGNGTMRLQMDRSERQRIGVAKDPIVSPTSAAATTLSDASTCHAVPECGTNEVLVEELNRCVSTTCSQFLFIKSDSETGECWISFGVVSTATVLLLSAAFGELLLTSVTMWTWGEMGKLAHHKRRDP